MGGGGGMGGGMGGGDYPNAGNASGGDERGAPASRVHIAPVQVSGEYWLADGVKLPDSKKATLLPAVYAPIAGESFVFKPLAEGLKKNKEIPLGSRIGADAYHPAGRTRVGDDDDRSHVRHTLLARRHALSSFPSASRKSPAHAVGDGRRS